jgi:hypothetical protein
MQGHAAFIPVCLVLTGAVLSFSGTAPQSSAQPSGALGSFDVQISLSQKAAAKLNSLSEGIVIAATYFGNPAPGAKTNLNQVGQIDLGGETVEISGRPQEVHISSPRIRQSVLSEVQGPVLLNVNVYSARRTGQDNILNCDFFDGNLQEAVHKPVALHCSLLSERAESSNGPGPIPENRLADSYAIYSLLLPGARFDAISPSQIKHWSLADTTVSIADMNPAIPPNGQLKAPPDNVKGFNEAVQDFEARRYERFRLDSASFHSGQPPPLIGQQQITDLRHAAQGNSGVAFFSAVYFNSNQTAALVYVNNWCANLCAVGQWVYFEKHSGQWVRRSGIVHGGA